MANMQGELPDLIQTYFYCRKCCQNIPYGETKRSWARLVVGYTATGAIQVRCVRHDLNVFCSGNVESV